MVADKCPTGPIGLNPTGPIGLIGPNPNGLSGPIGPNRHSRPCTLLSTPDLLSEGCRVLHSAKMPPMGSTRCTSHWWHFF